MRVSGVDFGRVFLTPILNPRQVNPRYPTWVEPPYLMKEWNNLKTGSVQW